MIGGDCASVDIALGWSWLLAWRLARWMIVIVVKM